MTKKKNFQDLNLSNSFLFTAVMRNPDICQEIIELILGFPIARIKVDTEKDFAANPDYRGVRLDVYAVDEEQALYNLEMQTTNKGDLRQRSRYYQGHIDVSFLRPRENFKKLGKSYVIFICTFDPFGFGRYRYTFEERCLEDDIPLMDGTKKIFLNTRGKNDSEISGNLIHFLKYLENSTDEYVEQTDDTLIHTIHEEIGLIKRNLEEERSYMSIQEWVEDQIAEGVEEGIRERLIERDAKMAKLAEVMKKSGAFEDTFRLLQEPELLETMLKKYHIE